MRRAILQIHLWTGIIVAAYVTVLGITGSVLVFRAELERAARPWPWKLDRSAGADVDTVLRNIEARYPGWRILAIHAPDEHQPGFMADLQRRTRIAVACDPATGAVLGELPPGPHWLRLIQDLHETWLIGRTGRVVNGIGSSLVLLMSATGIVIWWRRRTFAVDFRRRWRRVNFDLHQATGIWALAFLAVWGATAIYFAWPAQIITWVHGLSPLVNSRPPSINVMPQDGDATLSGMVHQAQTLDSAAKWKGIRMPFGPRAPLQVIMGRPGGEGNEYEDILFFDPYTGQHLRTWRYGVKESLGDWLIWAQAPLHFGTSWGIAVKLLWAAAGLAFPVLAVTGLLMYWNRALRRRFHPARAPTQPPTLLPRSPTLPGRRTR